MKVLAEEPWSWMLVEHEHTLLLSVVCGDSTRYVLNLRLTPAEAAAFHGRGNAFLAGLARDVALQPEKYLERSLGGFDDIVGLREAALEWRRANQGEP
jgi:hypothetical protein